MAVALAEFVARPARPRVGDTTKPCVPTSPLMLHMHPTPHPGLIHRDLAIRNVLVFAYQHDDPNAVSVKVSDFGLTLNLYTGATHKVGTRR